MKIPNIQARPLRGAFYLLLLVAVSANPFALAQRNAAKQRVDKLGSASKGLVGVGTPLPANQLTVLNPTDTVRRSVRDAPGSASDAGTSDATRLSAPSWGPSRH